MTKNTKENTRQVILNHAYRLFYQKGYHATGMEELMRAAQVHKGSVYYHFKDKKAILLSVINELMSENLKTVYLPLQSSEDRLKTLFQILQFDESFDFQHGCALNNFVQEMSPLDNEVAIALKKIYRQLEGYFIFALQDQTNLEQHELESLAKTLVAGVEGGLMAAKSAQDGSHYFQVLECLYQLTTSYLNAACDRR